MKATADVLAEHGERAAVCLRSSAPSGRAGFSGRVATVRCFEANALVRASLEERAGAVGVPLAFGGVVFEPGSLLYADADGVVVVAG